MTQTLDVYLYGSPAATLTYLGPSRYRLDYLPEWLGSEFAVPLSVSLPLTTRSHKGVGLTDFIDNLLPDNTAVRDRWAVEAGLPDTELFGLLGAYGRDVAGAAQFIRAGELVPQSGSLTPMTDSDIARRIRMIRDDATLWNDPDSRAGLFSLGGAQAKFALAKVGGRWFDPSGEHPATHIFKPKVQSQVDGELVEYVTMRAAEFLEISVAKVSAGCFDDEHSLVVERFDRVETDGAFDRIHQEDLAQALATPRLKKYEEHGGPSYHQILALLDSLDSTEQSAVSKQIFVQGLIFSWMVLNTDAHAKNYSLRLAPGQTVLAPLYDISSFIPYARTPGESSQRIRTKFADTNLSMRVASSYRSGAMTGFEWRGVSRDAGLDTTEVLDWAKRVAAALPTAVSAAASTLPPKLHTDTVALYVERIGLRAEQVLKALHT